MDGGKDGRTDGWTDGWIEYSLITTVIEVLS